MATKLINIDSALPFFFSFSVGHSSWINVRGQKLPLSLVIFLNNLWLPNIDIHQLDCKDSVRIMM